MSLVDMDIYSTALWHLQATEQLSALGMYCLRHDSHATETWIVIGNIFSLTKEHEIALKFFRRAVQCNQIAVGYACGVVTHAHSPYPSTLSAHEYISLDDFDRAAIGYRHSLMHSTRSYQAWYGLGNMYLRQEKYAMASYHFKKAIAIHASNSVLWCYLGMTYHACKRYDQALDAFDHAIKIEPNNSLARYHIAHVYLSQGDLDRAMKELCVLEKIIPKEANVKMMMARIEKKRGDVSWEREREGGRRRRKYECIDDCSLDAHSPLCFRSLPSQLNAAMFHYVAALDLDPKDRVQIKSAIDQLHSGNVDDEEEEEEAQQQQSMQS